MKSDGEGHIGLVVAVVGCLGHQARFVPQGP
jgi:hypothetical protein